MRIKYATKLLVPLLAALLGIGMAVGPTFAAEYWLCAKSFDMEMPDTTMVPMWGFALSTNAFGDNCTGTAMVPGPKLTVPSGDSTLTIHLRNNLSGPGIEPVSIVIPGQAMPSGFAPVFDNGRVRSFVQEAATGSGEQTYTWNNLQPGSYLYQSGTHPQVQVQMGLYGALTKDSAASTAYAGVPYTQERDLFYSEVDPALHAAVNDGSYGTTGPFSTLDYQPKYFLLSGYGGGISHDVSIDTAMLPSPTCINSGIGQGDRLLLRLYNAGLRELAPMMLGAHFDLVAEGGKPYPFARTQYQTLLVPGSTKDAIFTPEYEDDFKIIERRLNLTDAAITGGGMQACITVAGVSNTAPVVTISAPADGASFNLGDTVNFAGTANDTEDGTISANLSWSSSIDGNIGSGASFSTTSLSAGFHIITASVTDSGGLSGSDIISMTVVDPTNTAPVVTITAPADGASFNLGDTVNFAGTAVDTQDGTISANLSWSSSIDGNIGSGASFSTTSLSAGIHTVTASVTDSGGLPGSDFINITVNVVTNTAPVVTITNPSDGATFTQIDSIPFTGTAIDNEDGDISGNLSWTSDHPGVTNPIGSGGSFSTTLPVGTHNITASATDGGGLSGSDSITVKINAAATDTFSDVKAVYKGGPDRLRVEFKSSDTSGNRIMTVELDQDNDGTFERNLGTASSLNGAEKYRLDVQPFPDPDPIAGSMVRITSDLGGTVTWPVTID